ncbi:CDP-2,3-bis-(O-geranylgeranyl)-sn-glycerol synthase [Candidatus Woesearchaeota archaeon]|nr:CDP-2,3-bis-(O-geranylgeranyl)-sn-glycerol synthase [Candidatus Woesearchaeota archaeon]
MYMLLPALLANLVPPLFRKVNFLGYPVDLGARWKGKPLFGSHKTYRGLFFGITAAIIIAYVQSVLFSSSGWLRQASLIDYSAHNFVILGMLLGFGALFGDLVKSFFKRRVGVKPGKPWIPFDQLDFVVGALLFLALVYIPSWKVMLFLLVVVPILHILTNHIGFYLGINKSKW